MRGLLGFFLLGFAFGIITAGVPALNYILSLEPCRVQTVVDNSLVHMVSEGECIHLKMQSLLRGEEKRIL